MKKILSFLLITVLVLLGLVSCGHTHSFSPDWSKDETHHWHDCTDESCNEKADNAAHSYGEPDSISDTQHKSTCVCGAELVGEHSLGSWVNAGDTQHKKSCDCGYEVAENHTWDEGEITTEPTPDADGVMTYTCTAGCGATKTEDVEYVDPTTPGMTETQWNNAFLFPYTDYTITSVSGAITQITYFDGTTVKVVMTGGGNTDEQYYTVYGGDYLFFMLSDGTLSSSAATKVEYDYARGGSLGAMFVYSNFEFDEDTETYTSIADVTLTSPMGDVVYSDIVITFLGGKLVSISYNSSKAGEPEVAGNITVDYEDVDVIVIPTPSAYTLNPYVNVEWDTTEQIKSMSHLHAFDQAKFNQALADGYQHFAISHYAPSKPIYPLSDYFGGIPEGVIGSPNTEKVYAYNSSAHYNSLGSFAEGGGHTSGKIATWQAMFDFILDGLQFADGGGITLNHPGYPTTSTVQHYMDMLDYDPRVLGIEIYNDSSFHGSDKTEDGYGMYLEEWDTILSTGRRCWGFGVEDWHVTGSGWGSNMLLVPAVTEHDALKAYRDGQFYVQLADTGLRFTDLSLVGNRIYVSTNRETEIRFVSNNGEVVKTVTGTSAYYDVEADDIYVRVEAIEDVNYTVGGFNNIDDVDIKASAIYSQPFMFVEDARPERTHFHTYSEEWSSDANYHWHAATCDVNEACPYMYTAKSAHVDEDENDVCDTCNRKLSYTVTVNESSDKIELVTTGAIGGAIGTDVYFTVAVDEGYDLIVGVGARIFGRPTVVGEKKHYTVKVTAITADMTIGLGVSAEGHYDYSTVGTGNFTTATGESTTSTATLYYNPTAKTYSAAATGAEGEVTYTVAFKNGAATIIDSVNNTYTIDKRIEILSVSGSDGSTTLTFNDEEFGAGDLIPMRTWLLSTNTGSNPRPFPAFYPITYNFGAPTTKDSADDGIIYEFKTDMVINEGNGSIGTVMYVELHGTGGMKAMTMISRLSATDVRFFAPNTSTATSSANKADATLGQKINYRITVSESQTAGKVDVTLYINGTQAGNVLTTDAFDVTAVKFVLQDDGQDRNSTITLSNTYFFQYKLDYTTLEPSTSTNMPTTDVEGATVTKTIYANRDSYTVTAPANMAGYTTYTVTYKNGVDVTVNADGSVTYTKVARIISLKDENGEETTIAFVGKTYGASGEGVTTVIPTRDWLGTNAGFRGDGAQILWTGSSFDYVYPTDYELEADEELYDLVGDIISVVEFDMTVSSEYENDNMNNPIFSIVHLKAGGTSAVTLHMQRRSGAVQVQNNNDNYTWIKVAEIGEIFTIRIEYRKNGDNFDYVYYANGAYLFTKTVTADNACDGRFQINMRDDGTSNRNNVVTIHTFKYLEYKVTKVEDTTGGDNIGDGDNTGDNGGDNSGDTPAVNNPYEPETPDMLATESASASTATKTLYYDSTTGTYSATAGDVVYSITYKNGIDVTVNPDGSITYSKVATIVSLKDADGNDTTITYNGKTYGASGEGVITYVPHRAFFTATSIDTDSSNRLFVSGTKVLGNDSHTYGTYVEAPDDAVDKTVIAIVEADLKFEAVGDAASATMFQIIMNNNNGSPVGNVFFCRNEDGTISIEAPGIARTNIGVSLGTSFKFRMELIRTGDGGARKIVISINGTKLAEAENTLFIRGDFQFNLYDYAYARNHVVTIDNFKWIRYCEDAVAFGKS